MNKFDILRITFLSILSLNSALVFAADWTTIEDSGTLYDKKSIERLTNGNIRVWQKYILALNVREKLQSDLLDGGTKLNYQDYKFSVSLWEYDCKGKRFAVVNGNDYSTDGQVINSFEISQPKFNRLIPESNGEIVFQSICSVSLKKSQNK